MKLVLAAHTADGTTFKVGSHHYARELSRLGHEVLHISTPHSRLLGLIRKDERGALASQGLRRDDNGVAHLVPTRMLPARLNHARLNLRREIAAAGFTDADWVLVDQPMMHRVVRAFGPSTRVLYRPTDLYTSGAYVAGQRDLVARADAVVATSPAVLRSLDVRPGVPTLVIENGVELEPFMQAAQSTVERRGAVYIGALDHRFDWDALNAVAETLALQDESVDVFGPANDAPAVRANVHLRGPVTYAEVPRLLAAARIGLMPFTPTDLNRGRSPMKLYEYLAAGVRVVGPDFIDRTPPALSSRVHTYAGASQIAGATEAALTGDQVNDADPLREFDWREKALALEALLSARPNEGAGS